MGDHIVYIDSNRSETGHGSYTLFLTRPIINIGRVELLTVMTPNYSGNQFLTLDIVELRTPRNLVADSLTLTNNVFVPTSNAHYGSFATFPVDSKFNSNYRIAVDYPSRIDKLERLTIQWRLPDTGAPISSGTIGRNMFLLRFETIFVPVSPTGPVKSITVTEEPPDLNHGMMVAGAALASILVIIL